MAKFQALRYLGFNDAKMKLLYSVEKGVKHIKLVVKAGSRNYVLDNYNKKFRELKIKEAK